MKESNESTYKSNTSRSVSSLIPLSPRTPLFLSVIASFFTDFFIISSLFDPVQIILPELKIKKHIFGSVIL